MENTNQPLEIWKDVPGYEGDYQISNLGIIKSFKNNKITFKKGCINSKGYLHFRFCGKSGNKTIKIHRLVAELFIPNPQNKPEVNHIGKYPDGREGNKLDNRAVSLKWATKLENMNHASLNGLVNCKIKNPNYFNGKSKLKAEDVIQIRQSKLKQNELALIYKVSRQTISSIITKRTWKDTAS